LRPDAEHAFDGYFADRVTVVREHVRQRRHCSIAELVGTQHALSIEHAPRGIIAGGLAGEVPDDCADHERTDRQTIDATPNGLRQVRDRSAHSNPRFYTPERLSTD